MIYAEKYLRERYAQGKAEGIAEGQAQGIAQGKKETNEMWERWYRSLTDSGLNENDLPPPPSQTEDD